MKRKIDTLEGRRTYSKRLGIVEPVFGNIRSCKKMDRFTLRGRIKVNIQWLLYCLVQNIEKIANYGKSYATAPAWQGGKAGVVPGLRGLWILTRSKFVVMHSHDLALL